MFFKINRYVIFFTLLFIIYSCSTAQKNGQEETAEEVYKKAKEDFDDGDYKEAITGFEKIKTKFPFSKYAVVADLMIGDAHFKQGEYLQAVLYYQEFIKLHPTNPEIPYAKYNLALSHFKEAVNYSLIVRLKMWLNSNWNTLAIDRDISEIKEAVNAFQSLIIEHPDSQYAKLAKEKLKICIKNIIAHNFYVGYSYFKRGDYYSAIQRFDYIINNYPEENIIDKSLYYKGISYLKINDKKLARETLTTLIQKFPESKFRKKAENKIKSIG